MTYNLYYEDPNGGLHDYDELKKWHYTKYNAKYEELENLKEAVRKKQEEIDQSEIASWDDFIAEKNQKLAKLGLLGKKLRKVVD